MNAAWKVIGSLILFLGVLLVMFSHRDVVPFLNDDLKSAPQRLESLWNRDLIDLGGFKKLHPGFSKVSEIKLNYGSDTARRWVEAIKVPILIKPDGTFRLDIFVDHFRDQKIYGAVIQYQLVDKNSGDTIWELGRTLELGELTEDEMEQLESKSTPPTTQPLSEPSK